MKMDEKKLQYLYDRMLIQDRIYLYCELVDTKNFDLITQLFTEDALIDYTTCGSIKGSPRELVASLKKSFTVFSASQHIVTNLLIKINDDGTAQSSHYLYNPMSWKNKKGVTSTMLFGSRYEGEWIKDTDGEWKLTRFEQIKNYRLTPIINEG